VKEHESRLSLVSRDATSHLWRLSSDQQRAIAQQVAEWALARALPTHTSPRWPTTTGERTELALAFERELEQFEESYFTASAAAEIGQATQAEVDVAFARARALNACLYALARNSFEAAAEAAYEAHAAIDDLPSLLRLLFARSGGPNQW
jgi:hypothetical protein